MNHDQAVALIKALMEREHLSDAVGSLFLSYLNDCEDVKDERDRLLEAIGNMRATLDIHLRDMQYAQKCIQEAEGITVSAQTFPKPSEMVVDLFAGGGGMSCAIEQAGFSVDVAINHDAEAIAMHTANHSTTRHQASLPVSPQTPGYKAWKAASADHPLGLSDLENLIRAIDDHQEAEHEHHVLQHQNQIIFHEEGIS